MSINKLALLRYKTIDKCLQNRYRKWTLEDLIDAVSDALYEYEGMNSGISKRTIQLDIQNMRSDKLGYNAPIVVIDKKYYQYEEKDFTITKSKLSSNDLEILNDAIRMLSQFKGFNYFEDMSAIIGKLENKVQSQNKKPKQYIHFEKNELLTGLHWIDVLHEAIKEKKVLEIGYQSFKATKINTRQYHPYLLKEYRNRWFLMCRDGNKKDILILALDRIKSVDPAKISKFIAPEFEPYLYFDDCIGVTKSLNQQTNTIVLAFDKANAPYVITKPLHTSQKVLKEDHDEVIVTINVVMNFELEREILGFGKSVKVLAPRLLQKKIQENISLALRKYDPT
jgi:predicted DNA-binding transcriptional regulator YafY